MTPYRWIRPVFWLLFLSQIVFWYLDQIPIWLPIVFALTYVTFLAWAAFHMNANFFTKSINSGAQNQPGIAITFDDGPHPIHTTEVLEILEKHNAKATFFLIGTQAKKERNLVLKLHQKGHLIGNHSASHDKWIDFGKKHDWINEIDETNQTIQNIIGKTPRWFRPPYGVTTPHLDKAIKETNVLPIGWNVRSLDTLNNNVSEIVNRATQDLKDGSIVLFHDNLEWSAKVLDEFLIKAASLNLKVVPLNELINEKAYE